MSVEEDAARLRAIQLPFARCQEIMHELDHAREQAAAALGSSGTGLGVISGAVEQAKAQADGLYSAIQEVEHRIDQAATGLIQG